MYDFHYRHYLWYDKIMALHDAKTYFKNLTAIPYYFKLFWIKLQDKLKIKDYIPTYWEPKSDEWLKYGCSIRTRESFKYNLLHVVKLAQKKETPLLIMTYAYYIPENYSYENYVAGKLDWAAHKWPIEEVGKPECVNNGMTIHNEVIEEIYKNNNNQNLFFVDFNQIIPKNKTTFEDACHFTDKGVDIMVEEIINSVNKNLRQPFSKRKPLKELYFRE